MEKEELGYWKKNAEEDYMSTPISVLRYISELEKYIMFDVNNITWTVDHDCGLNNDAFLIGDYKGTRFIEVFNTKSWFSLGLMFAKWKIKRLFKIIYEEQNGDYYKS